MNLSSRQPKIIDAAKDPFATGIAIKILRWQEQASKRMNRMVGHYSPRRQGWILTLVIVLLAGAMVISLVLQRGKPAPNFSGNYISRHIGEASNGKPAGEDVILKTDSLTRRK